IAAQHRLAGAVDRQRLGFSQRQRNFTRPGVAELGLERALVDRRRAHLELDSGRAEHGPPRSALGCEYDHIGWVPVSAGRCCRSVQSLITAAAVSSIERRVTSITGQPLSANNRLAKATSCSTRSSST